MNASNSHPIMECPNCRGSLEKREAVYLCSSCGEVGREIDSIPCFTDPAYYWGEIPREAMQHVNEVARERGWDKAIEECVQDQELRYYVSDLKRADFQHIWDLPQGARVLDVGAGWGAIAHSLARNFHVTAVEGVLERCKFINTRAQQTGAPVVAVCADFLRLPLAPAQFDAVVLNGVVEWIGLSKKTGDPRDLQVQFLGNIHRLLKPGGFACVGIENRIGVAVFRGAVDHSGLPYTSLMPRSLAGPWCRLKKPEFRSDANTDYRTYTYSLPGYKKLFRDAGFQGVRSFHAWDGYNRPSTLLPLDNKDALLHFNKRQHGGQGGWKGALKNAILPLSIHGGLWKHFASEYIFLVEKE